MKTHRDCLFEFKQTVYHHDEARGIDPFSTKNLVEIMGGKIEVESEVGVGTLFKIYFKKA